MINIKNTFEKNLEKCSIELLEHVEKHKNISYLEYIMSNGDLQKILKIKKRQY